MLLIDESAASADGHGYVYLLAWETPAKTIIKAGFATTPQRWKRFVRRGARLVMLAQGRVREARYIEAMVHDLLTHDMPKAFTSPEQADRSLRGMSGWTECYVGNLPWAERWFGTIVRVIRSGEPGWEGEVGA